MPDEYKFFLQNFEDLSKFEYNKWVNKSHIFHSVEWMGAIKETFGINYKIAILKKNDEITASIPFVSYLNLFKGRCALPLHFSSYYDSIVADNIIEKKKILERFFKYCESSRLYTQIPEINKIEGFRSFLGYSYYVMKLNSNTSIENQVLSSTNKRTSSYIKNAMKSNLTFNVGGFEFLDEYYILYLQNMKELGTPPLPKKFFKKIIKYLPNDAKIILVKYQKKIHSGMFVIKVSKTELFAFNTCTPRMYKSKSSTYFLYLQAAEVAHKFGCTSINFGRSIDGSGTAIFKQRFGIKPTPLLMYSNHKNWAVNNPEKSKFKYAVALWKKNTYTNDKAWWNYIIKAYNLTIKILRYFNTS
jgi:hypothetical protein